MQSRNIGNEILVAIGAVGVIALALVFGTLVTLPTLLRQNTNATAQPTQPPLIVTTQGVASMTDPATLTVTSSLTDMATASLTPQPVLSVTATLTTTPSATVTQTPTVTPTASASATPTRTSTPTVTPTTSPSRTPVSTATATETATPAPCSQPEGWVTYVVRSGDTLFTIARSVGSTVAELSRVNCLSNADRIITGDRLFVPRLPPTSSRNPAGGGQSSATSNQPGMGRYGCTEPAIATITHPRAGMTVSGTVTVSGTASLPEGFGFYKLEVRPDTALIYNFWASAHAPVIGGQLGALDTRSFGTGMHWLRLVVVGEDGSTPPGTICTIPLFFR